MFQLKVNHRLLALSAYILLLTSTPAHTRKAKIGSLFYTPSELATELEDITETPKLDLKSLKARAGKQAFKEAAQGSEDGVALGLIDALQRWADALEAQITLMRTEVVDLKGSNRKLKDDIGKVKLENRALRAETERLRTEAAQVKGNNEKEQEHMTLKIDGMRNDLKVFSKSFSDFLEHYDRTVRDSKNNNTLVRRELEWAKNNIKGLSSTLGDSDKGFDSVRASIQKLTDSVTVLTQADYILEERIKNNENRSDSYASTLNKEFMKLRSNMVTNVAFSEVYTNMTKDIAQIRNDNEMNVTTLAFSVKALEQSLKLALHNSSSDFADGMADLEGLIDRLQGDLKLQTKAFREDFMNFQKSIDFAKLKYDELRDTTTRLGVKLQDQTDQLVSVGGQLEQKLATQDDIRTNLTTAVLKAMNDFGNRLTDAENELVTLRPDMDEVNESLNTFVGQMGKEIVNLQRADDGFRGWIDQMEASVEDHKVTTYINGNATYSLNEKLDDLASGLLRLKGKDIAQLHGNIEEGRKNSTIIVNGVRNLEKHFIDLKRDLFEKNLRLAGLNESVISLGESAQGLRTVQEGLEESRAEITARLSGVDAVTKALTEDMGLMWNNTSTLSGRLQKLTDNVTASQGNTNSMFDKVSSVYIGQRKALDGLYNMTNRLEQGFNVLGNYSNEMQSNMSRMLVFAAGNKAEILELKVVGNGLEDKLDRLYELHHLQTTRVTEASWHAEGNITKLSTLTNTLEDDLDSMGMRFETLEKLLSNFVTSTDELENNVVRIQEDAKDTRGDLEAMRFDLKQVKAKTAGVDVFASSIQSHIATLTSNITSVAGNLTLTRQGVLGLRSQMDAAFDAIDDLNANVTENRNGLLLADEQFQILRLNSSTLKANIMGLGNYINNINGDVGKLASTFEKYIGDITKGMVSMSDNMTSMEAAFAQESEDVRSSLQAVENMSTSLKGEIATLVTKTYTMKTTIFEQQNELSSLRADHNNLVSTAENIEESMGGFLSENEDTGSSISALRTDMSTLRTGLTSLTNSLFNLKTQVLDANDVDGKLQKLGGEIGSLGDKVGYLESELTEMEPQLSGLTTDVTTFRTSMSLLASEVSSNTDPPRFSCSVTSDEIRTSGVITYNICNVNKDSLMDRETGHVSIKRAGDYFVSFTGNMVSVNAQAVWCALYKQSAGNEGWQVLGMINNYQRNGDNMDDRDSGSLSLITSLKEGDQIWVEWRGYGESFLYSNPYRLISFTGFMIKQA